MDDKHRGSPSSRLLEPFDDEEDIDFADLESFILVSSSTQAKECNALTRKTIRVEDGG